MFSSWRGDLLALFAGLLFPLAFAPLELYPLAIVSLALLFSLWLHSMPKRALLRGGLFGLGMFGHGASWIFVSIHDFGHVPFGLSLFLTILFIIVVSIFPALAGYIASRLSHLQSPPLKRLRMILIYPAVWTLLEWVRGWFLTGFPWLNLGYSQIDAPLAGLAPLTGVYGVTLAAALTSALLVAALANPHGVIRASYLLLIAGLWAVSVGLGKVVWTQQAGGPIQVSMVQGNISQDMKWLPEMRQPTVDLYTEMTREHWDSDLIIWPETAMPTFYHHATDYLAYLRDEAIANNTDMLVGIIYQEPESKKYYNSMVSIGRQQGFYHKHHLVPFTEYLPFHDVLAGLVEILDVPMSDFSAGDATQAPLQVAGQRVGISICYEDAFGEETINALPEATLLVNVSNDAWFGGSIAPQQHLQIARMRALETGRPLLRSTNTGVTAFIEPDGRISQAAPQFDTHVLTADVQPMQGATPYVRTGNYLMLFLAITMIAAGLLYTRRKKS